MIFFGWIINVTNRQKDKAKSAARALCPTCALMLIASFFHTDADYIIIIIIYNNLFIYSALFNMQGDQKRITTIMRHFISWKPVLWDVSVGVLLQ